MLAGGRARIKRIAPVTELVQTGARRVKTVDHPLFQESEEDSARILGTAIRPVVRDAFNDRQLLRWPHQVETPPVLAPRCCLQPCQAVAHDLLCIELLESAYRSGAVEMNGQRAIGQ